MGWWSLSGWPEALVGDGGADIAGSALSALGVARAKAGKPAPKHEDVLASLTLAIGAGARECIAPMPHCVFEGLVATFDDGTEIRAMRDISPAPPPDEIKPLRAMLKALRTEYKDSELARKPLMREVLESMTFVLRPMPNSQLDAEEARKLSNIKALLRDERGALSQETVLAALAVALRRNAGKLGDLVDGGGGMRLGELVATTESGADIRLSCATTKGDSFVVDELSEMFESVASYFRRRSNRLPSMDEMTAEMLSALQRRPERFDVTRVTALSVSSTTAPASSRGPTESTPAPIRVRHPKFGDGYVVRVIDGPDRKFEIHFNQGGTKTLLARFVEVVTGPTGA